MLKIRFDSLKYIDLESVKVISNGIEKKPNDLVRMFEKVMNQNYWTGDLFR